MATFTLNSITVQGLNIIARLVAGSTLEFTRIAVGDGAMPSDKTPLTVTDLSHRLFDVPINKVESYGNQEATVSGIFDNQGLETGFFYRELGLYAKDPNTKEEVLYCYGNAAADAEWIPPSGASSIIEKQVKIVTLVGNAEKVTADIKSGIYATKEELEESLKIKADLDAPAEDGGRVPAEQMRFDAEQVLYVDAAAKEDGDGSEQRPFKTIQAAIDARYLGAAVIYIKIKAGTYPENIQTPRAPGTTWRFTREGTGAVIINTAIIDNCNYLLFDNLTFGGPVKENSTVIYLANVATVNFNSVTVNGATNATGISLSTSCGVIKNTVINNCGLAVAASDGAYLNMENTSGIGNVRGVHSAGAIVVCGTHTIQATTPFEKINGGVVSINGEIYANSLLADGTKISLKHNEIDKSQKPTDRNKHLHLSFYDKNGTDNTKNRLGKIEYTHRTDGAAQLLMAVNDPSRADEEILCGIFVSWLNGIPRASITHTPDKSSNDSQIANTAWVKSLVATTEEYGLVRLATEEDALKDDATDAAITPAVYHDVSDFRHKGTAYSLGDKVECMFNHELFLECTKAGTTASTPLDTRNVKHGQVLTDGGVQWTVRTHIKSVNGVVADSNGNVNVKEYTHPLSGVNAGTYRKVTVDTKGHVTAGVGGAVPISEGGTGATTAATALSNLGGVPKTDIGNAANKIPQYNANGHLVLPNGAEFWIA